MSTPCCTAAVTCVSATAAPFVSGKIDEAGSARFVGNKSKTWLRPSNHRPAFSQNINPYPIKMILPDFPATNQICHQNLQVVVLPFDIIWAQFILFNRSCFFAQFVDSKCKTLSRPSNLRSVFPQNMMPCYQKTCKFTFKNYIVCLKRSDQRLH
jgi:hypothetical protein